MAAVDTAAEWLQLGINAAALVGGGVVWKMYFENLKATVGTKQAEVELATRQVDNLKDKVAELEKRSPEVVERVLAERIDIRESEMERLKADKDQGTQELKRVEQEVALLRRTLDQTKGFREMLAMEAEPPQPGDPDYEMYRQWMEEHDDEEDDEVVEISVEHLGNVGVDSGQLLITDPCYIDGEWQVEPFQALDRVYRDTETGAVISWGYGQDFVRFDEPLKGYGATPSALIESGRWEQIPLPTPDTFAYSYNGACQATLKHGHGELVYRRGHAGAGVAFRTAWGDGDYPIYGEKHDGRIVRVYVNVG